MRRAVLLAALAAALPGAVSAQGALSVQGYGYPTGQVSAGSLALGGAPAEVDPASPLNPAALASPSRYSIYVQYEPEFRRTTLGGATAESRTMRFPGFLVTGSFRRFTAAISASTLLDRTWRNVYVDTQLVGGDYVQSTLTAASSGAITDARVAGAYWINQKLQVGLGVHGLAGENRLEFGRSFPDTSGIGGVTQLSTINYSGGAVSLGAVWYPVQGMVVGGSMRRGGRLEAEQDGNALAEADVPDRFGLTVGWTGIPNTTLAARFERTAWSGMRDLGTAQMSVFDANDLGLGLEVAGPRLAGAPSFARLGLRSRTLPFGANGDRVSERSISGGIALPVARGRGQVDLSLQRSARRAGDADERAWFVSIGLGIRP